MGRGGAHSIAGSSLCTTRGKRKGCELPRITHGWLVCGHLRSDLTTSILALESQRGISASLCVQFSGWSVFMQSSVAPRARELWYWARVRRRLTTD